MENICWWWKLLNSKYQTLSTDFWIPHLRQQCFVNSAMTEGLLRSCKNPTAISCVVLFLQCPAGLQTLWKLQSQIALKINICKCITSILKTWYRPSLPIPHWSSSKLSASRSISWSTQSNTRHFQAMKMIRKDPYCWWWSSLILP